MVRIAGVQFGSHLDKEVNLATATRLIREAARRGAQIVCPPELFSTIYFCVETRPAYFDWAETIPGPTTERMAALARETGTVLICPIFERTDDGRFFNTAAVLGPDGELIGKYRKSSIPFMDCGRSAEPRGNEKFYFEPGDLELRAHAVTNIYYVCGVNKVGVDVGGSTRNHFGSSLVANPRGEIIAQASDTEDDIVVADVDPSVILELRTMWGYYRDRRPEVYGPLVEKLGEQT